MFIMAAFLNSPGRLTPLKDTQGNIIPGSVSEKVWIDINGIKQGMFIRGEDIQNPVLLYLHGGPGTPLFQFISYLEKEERLERYFTVCYWDQRGAGMTYDKSTDPTTMTVDQLVEDTREVTEYLKSRFGQNKIYLLGHSWGSYLGVKTIEKYPENYLAYIGIGLAIALGTILGYSAMAGAVGGGGLGDIAIRYGYNRYQLDIMIVTVILLVALVQIMQAICMRLSRKLDKRITG